MRMWRGCGEDDGDDEDVTRTMRMTGMWQRRCGWRGRGGDDGDNGDAARTMGMMGMWRGRGRRRGGDDGNDGDMARIWGLHSNQLKPEEADVKQRFSSEHKASSPD